MSAVNAASAPPARWSPCRWLLAWLFLGTWLTVLFVVGDSLSGIPLRLGMLAALGFSLSVLWLLVAPVVWTWSCPWPPSFGARIRHALAHLAVSLAFALIVCSVFSLVAWVTFRGFIADGYAYSRAFETVINYFLIANVLLYGLVIAARAAFDFAQGMRQQALQVAQAREQLSAARLDVLRMQMQPHFLFNALGSVAGLVRTGQSDTALEVLARLGDVLRGSLAKEDQSEAPLEVELNVALDYVEIERCRFGDRLDFRLEVEPEAEELLVPRWVLQPLLENAFHHGLEADPEASRVTLRALLAREDALRLEVEDDGPGAEEEAEPGIGLGNTAERLRQLYGDDGRLELIRQGARGTIARVTIPRRSSP